MGFAKAKLFYLTINSLLCDLPDFICSAELIMLTESFDQISLANEPSFARFSGNEISTLNRVSAE